ncbi:MAG: SusC/RagA family TonB-linked outer membrane protein [Bacteroidales bacterium]
MKKIFLFALLFLAGLGVHAQVTVTGTVKSAESEETLPGATIQEEDTNNGVMTDIDGNFEITVASEEASLIISFMGYKSQTLEVGEKREFEITLESEASLLDEVVVMGYGSAQSRETVVGSVEQVEMQDLSKISLATSADQMLEGQVAGVTVESASGDPTSPVRVRIRGENSLPEIGSGSFVASGEPLYVLDGVPLVDISDPNVQSGVGQAAETVVNPLTFVNPDDIETITVLKDASATAIYGANAANGVILITTKEGQRGATRVSLSQRVLMEQPINLMQYLHTDQYVELLTEYHMSNGMSQEEANNSISNQDVYTNWRDQTLKTAVSHRTNMSISGGNGGTTFRLSFGLQDNQTTSKGNDFTNITSRFNLSAELFENVRLTYNGGISSFERDAYSGFATYNFRPNIPLRDEDGDYTLMDGIAHPLAELEQNINNAERFYTNNSLELTADITDHLTWKGNFGLDYTNSKNFRYRSAENRSGMRDNGNIREQRRDNFNWTAYTQADYNREFNQHGISGTLGVQISEDNTTRTTVTDRDLISTIVILPGVGADQQQDVASYVNRSAMVSGYSRLNYNYDGRYFGSINLRRDASSYFGGDHSVEDFISGGASWNVSNEEFWPANNVVNYLKFKTSFGKTGNARIGSYAARGLYNYSTNAAYNGLVVVTPNTAPNPDLGWQSSYKFNAGFSAHLFDKLRMEVEFYKNWNVDAIMSMDVTPETGWRDISVNAANMTNTGLETTLRASDLDLGPVKWSPNFNIAFNRNELTKLANDQDIVFTNTGLIVGESTNLIMGFEYAGVNSQTGDPQWYLPDGSITEDYSEARNIDNRIVIGKSNPDFSGGFTNGFRYRNFTLTVLLTYEYGADFYLPFAARNAENTRQLNLFNMSVNTMDRWQQPGDETDIPRISNDIPYDYYSSRWLFDRSNIDLRSLSLNYTLPKGFSEKIRARSISAGLTVSNIFTFYLDGTRDDRNGIAEYRYPMPQARTYSFEFSINF